MVGTRKFHAHMMCGAAVIALTSYAGAARAAEDGLDIAPQPLAMALKEFGMKTGQPVLYGPSLADKKTSGPVVDAATPEAALVAMLSGTGLTFKRNGDTFLITKVDADPQSGSAAGDGAEVEALIVTAQKREEDIQDVPIAISAFTQEQLDRSQVAGGPDLMTQVPNMTFTKTNFSTYSIQLRGIGTQAISATVDHAVAVAFNNTPFIRNRFFEQEFYDLQRVEVLRGPQGTLYGRNATAGVVNLISNKPKFSYEARVSGDIANYNSSRLEGMINVPLVEDVVALRLAGAWTKREGYATNQLTGNPIDGRDLWSTRASLRFTPTDALDVNLIWEHFAEDDDRIRSGKQLCRTHTMTNFTAVHPDGTVREFETYQLQSLPDFGQNGFDDLSQPHNSISSVQGVFSQGCTPESLYSPDSFQTPNGLSLPYYGALSAIGLPAALIDPYASRSQSRDLRVIESMVDPRYKAETDVVELQVSFDLTDSLSITSETGYSSDFIFSTQDYNRFNTAPGAWSTTQHPRWLQRQILDSEGVFCDPQIGCSDRLVAVDLSTATSRHFSQELRIGSSFDGQFNFSLGANFLRYDTEDKYYVFINSLSMYAADQTALPSPYIGGVTDNFDCLPDGFVLPDPEGTATVGANGAFCQYIDPNPIESLNDLGHNYFLSRNPYKLISYALFGETYFQVTDALKLTAGLRWTVDQKEAPRIPSWLLGSRTVGLSAAEVVEQEWREPSGRLTADWKPVLGFTDETMVYASYAHGYKAGGMNPPAAGLVCYGGCAEYAPAWYRRAAAKPTSFEAEYVDAYEIGAKNTLLDGQLTLNLATFYYDYQDYQLSQIVDRAAITQGFDAKIWGIEIEADWRPLENLRLGFKGGYENTRVADGEQAIDVMDRTAGRKDWVVVSPFPTFPSNCVLPSFLFDAVDAAGTVDEVPDGQHFLLNLGGATGGSAAGCELAYLFRFDPVTGRPYVPNPTVSAFSRFGGTSLTLRPGYAGWDPTLDYGNNNGEGFYKELGGNELPNAPDYTATITVDYTIPLPNDWLATLHTDLYYQSEAWTRIFNTEGYDKLKAYTNVNLAAIFQQEELGWKVMAYVKNVFDRDSITGAFLNSDDTGLTTNVFLTDPRLYGIRVTKEWNGGPWWTGASMDHKGPFPLTVELAGQVQRHEAEYEPIRPTVNGMPAGFDAAEAQNRDFDWGDGREVKLMYRPNGSPWKMTASIRYGSANNDLARGHYNTFSAEKACAFPVGFPNQVICFPDDPRYNPAAMRGRQYLADSEAKAREEHQIIDFSVGHDFGLGMLAHSSVSGGLRNAQFSSDTEMAIRGKVDTLVPTGWVFLGYRFERYLLGMMAERGFEGTGPVVTWEAGLPLLGDDDTGRVSLDWTVTGGVLFGKQETTLTGEQTVTETVFGYYTGETTNAPVTTSLDLPTRTADVQVPVIDLSLGLAYEVGRVKIGAGYRWERYSDVLDVGYTEREDADRTIDGPYFKLAVGFGG